MAYSVDKDCPLQDFGEENNNRCWILNDRQATGFEQQVLNIMIYAATAALGTGIIYY